MHLSNHGGGGAFSVKEEPPSLTKDDIFSPENCSIFPMPKK